jgi:uncharacterized protein with WD repeat
MNDNAICIKYKDYSWRDIIMNVRRPSYKSLLCLPILTKTVKSHKIFLQIQNVKFYQYPSGEVILFNTDRRTNGRT